MGRRTTLLITGLVVAALGTLLVFIYANNVQRTAGAAGQQMQVYVATAPISVGTTGDAAAATLEQRPVPGSTVPAGAITDPATIAGKFAIVPIAAGQVVLADMFGQPAQASSLSIPEGKMGVAVQLGDAQRVAGFVQPGSEVAIFTTITESGVPTTRLLLPRATVAAVGPTTVVTRTTGAAGSENTEQMPTAIMTLALDQLEAEKIIYASGQSSLYFALLTPQSQTAPSNGVNAGNLWG